jgi:hypothetical protein
MERDAERLTEPVWVKGDRVRLPDGTQGKIAYLHREMRIVRVRTEDGRNITLRRSWLTVDRS